MRPVLFFLLFFCHTVYAQTSLRGTIVDQENKAPLHFATIAVAGQPYGTLSQADGSFVLSCPETLSPQTNIRVSFLGYATKEYTVAELQRASVVELSGKGLDLPMASISATGSIPLKTVSLGRTERKAYTFYQNDFEQTYQLASRVENPDNLSGAIGSVSYYFGKVAKTGKPVRLNFYAVDPGCGCPGEALHATSIIPEKVKKGWNKLDITTYQVVLPPTDFFIAFEWLRTSGAGEPTTNFSVGVVYDKNAKPIFEKLGGYDWEQALRRGSYRPLVRLEGKVE